MKKSQALIIDCQILQTAAFDRGMGKYTSSLLKAASANKDFTARYSQVYLLLSSNLVLSSERKLQIQSLIPSSELLILNLPIDIDQENTSKISLAEEVVTKACEKLEENFEISFLVTAPFFVGFASVFPAQKEIKKYSIVYDFIPYRIWNKQRIFPDEIYFQHFKLFLNADQLLTISEFVRSDLIELFGFSESLVTSIDGGPFEQTAPNNLQTRPMAENYIIYPSAPIIHKNNTIAVMGFEKFNNKQKNKYKLVITSTFDDATKKLLNKHSKNIVFTGNILDQELYRYYHHASALLFASLSEGLGMPVLEAIGHGLPVACSNIPVLTEISPQALYLFDPIDPVSIENSLKDAIDKNEFNNKLKYYKQIKEKYSWARTAKIMLESFNKNTNVAGQKKSLLIKSDAPTNNSKQARLLEYIFSQLYKNFNISLVFSEKRRTNQKLPSYVANLQLYQNNKDFDYTLEITKKTVLNRSKHDLNIRVINENKRFTSKKGTIYIVAQEKKVDEPLGFNDWQYKLNRDKKSTAEQIVKVIMNEIK